jgi:hypothetical protein
MEERSMTAEPADLEEIEKRWVELGGLMAALLRIPIEVSIHSKQSERAVTFVFCESAEFPEYDAAFTAGVLESMLDLLTGASLAMGVTFNVKRQHPQTRHAPGEATDGFLPF